MSNFVRRMQRKSLRMKSDYEAPAQPTVVTEAGYFTLRPTKGWVRISNRRLAAQRVMAGMLDHHIPERSKKAPKVWRQPAPCPAGIETRQQRRHSARHPV